MKAKRIILNVICVLFGLLFINGGIQKLVNFTPNPGGTLPPAMEEFNRALQTIGWLVPLIGIGELVGGILLIIPQFRALAVIVIAPIMLGVLMSNIFTYSAALPIVLAIWGLLLWLIFENKRKFLPLLRRYE